MNLLKHPLVCISTSTFVTQLHHLKCTPSSSSTTQKNAQLWIARLAYYFLILQKTLQAFLFTIDRELIYNPIGAFAVAQYSFLSSPLINSLCLVSCWGIFLDYALNYKLDSFLISNIYQLMVENGRHFRALNGRRLDWPRLDNIHWQLWRLPIAYIDLGRRIWKLSGSKTDQNDNLANLKFHITQTGIYSDQLRGKLLVFSNACEVIVISLNLIARK